MVSWSGGQWYSVVLEPDNNGTFDILSATLEATIIGGPEGFVPMTLTTTATRSTPAAATS